MLVFARSRSQNTPFPLSWTIRFRKAARALAGAPALQAGEGPRLRQAAWNEWVESRPEPARRLAVEFPLPRHFHVKGWVMHLIGYAESKDDVLIVSAIDPRQDYEAALAAKEYFHAAHVREDKPWPTQNESFSPAPSTKAPPSEHPHRIDISAAPGDDDGPPGGPKMKTLICGLALLFGGAWLWFALSGNPIHSLKLILRAKTAPGQIVDAHEDVGDNDRGGAVWFYWAVYRFTTPDGKLVTSRTPDCRGRLPDELEDLDTPVPVEVEYDPQDPSISRIKGSGMQTVAGWLLVEVLLGGAVLDLFMAPGFTLIKAAVVPNKRPSVSF